MDVRQGEPVLVLEGPPEVPQQQLLLLLPPLQLPNMRVVAAITLVLP